MGESEQHLIEETLSSEQLFKGGFLDLRRDQVRLPSGDSAWREYIVHPGAVAVVPLLDDGRVVLVRQYRLPLRRVMLEFPAGKIDPGESTRTCALRELAEETGYRASELARACDMHNAAAYSNEHIELWFARGLAAGAQALDHGEHIDVVEMSLDELEALAQRGELTDVKTLIGVMWLRRWRDGAWNLPWERV